MIEFEGVYGFEISKPLKLDGLTIQPVYQDFTKLQKLSKDENCYHLTGVIRYEKSTVEIDLFDLEGVLAFIDHRDVIVANKIQAKDMHEAISKLPSQINGLKRHGGGGKVIMSDAFSESSREDFTKLALDELAKDRNNGNLDRSVFRIAFFKTIEVFRARKQFREVSYYLLFSALESLARFSESDYTSSAEIPISQFLIGLGFDVKQNNPQNLRRSISTYSNLRNALFHNSQTKTEVNYNGDVVELNLNDYFGYFNRLMPLVIIKYLGFDDGHIRWQSWIDRQPFK
ncbi:hypothetical protein [Fodinibius sediminis]|uniref:Apea-like HEPN domain-containing protein n=1 Tax=Fodinibius sediminis TaxID=1214077 RepID=A0A521FEJ4_9BACT|nr:hypothetical protein [Fodinibius sediminis]SMO94612.1 hypothetical protein SAMN06265218_1328 [Fodinibius sediminis]